MKFKSRQESDHPEETEDTAVLGKGMLYKGKKMKTPSQLSYGLDYTGSGMGESLKITKEQLRQIILEYEQYVDEDGNVYDDEGNVTRRGAAFGRQYGGQTYTGSRPPWASRGSSPRKTTYVGEDANAERIEAVKALNPTKGTFLDSILTQLKSGRGLSDKQNKVMRNIMGKRSPESVALFEGYNSMSDAGISLAARAKRHFHKDYPEVRVGINAMDGWIEVEGKKAVNMSSASGRPMSLDDIVDKMKQAYLGHPMQEGKMKITKGQLRQIVREALDEGKCDKASGHEGCVRKRAKGWVVLSNKTGKPWRGGGEKDGDIVYYDSEAAAKKALGAYHG